jgi:D-galactose 1-dehydrogenase
MNRIRIAIIGMGKIAREQHVPAITASPAYDLVGVVSPDHPLDGVANFASIEALLDTIPGVEAVSICTPPQVRYQIARVALAHGKHTMLEKPPGSTLSEVASLAEIAQSHRATLFTAWHSRAASGVSSAREWLATRALRIGHIQWLDNVRVSHSGQSWIRRTGGFGVFDTGINALAIITRIMPSEVVLREAELFYPSNCETPMSANLVLDVQGASILAHFDFLHAGPKTRNIDIDTDEGRLLLSRGGALMHINGNAIVIGENHEYPHLYNEFETLIRERRSDVDVAPLRLVADAFLNGRRITGAPLPDE